MTNEGPNASANTVLTDTLPTGAVFNSATPAPASNVAQVLTFNLGSIPGGASVTVLVRMTPIVGLGVFLENKASVTATTVDPIPANNTSDLSSVVAAPDQADVAVTVTGATASIASTGLIYTATVVNNGPHVADHVVFTADATATATITSITTTQGAASQSGNVITALLGTLGVGQTVYITYVVDAAAGDALVTTHAGVGADERDPVPINNGAKFRTKVGQGAFDFFVTNTKDAGPGSLRQAILDSNDLPATIARPNPIAFKIPEADPGLNPAENAFVIRPLTVELSIFSPAILDGYTQPGASANTNPIDRADNAKIRIELDGRLAPKPANGLTVDADGTVIRGFAINRFVTKFKKKSDKLGRAVGGSGIEIDGGNSIVAGNYLGTDATGLVARGNETNGVVVFGSNNTIAGVADADRNILSGNAYAQAGTAISPFNNLFIGNFVGTDISGARALRTNLLSIQGTPITGAGIGLNGAMDRIGGLTPRERNVISGLDGTGVVITVNPGVPAASNERAIGNYIGTDLTGTKAVPNEGGGVYIDVGIDSTIGGVAPGERNIISGNAADGVTVNNAANVVLGNYIGTDVTGLRPLGNGGVGINLSSRLSGGTIGGTAPGAGNLIAANAGGILDSSIGFDIVGNTIGLDAAGKPMGNLSDGVLIFRQTTTPDAEGNALSADTIAFNGGHGVAIIASDSTLGGGTGNSIIGNSIYGNQRLGIDLGYDGVTPNHAPLVTSPGPNHLQNTPVFTSAVDAAGTTTVQGSIAGLANRDYAISFYANPYLDPPGITQGKTPVGAITAHTDAAGHATFSEPIALDLGGQYLTATATTANPEPNAPGADTSEFAPAILVAGKPPTPPPATSADLAIATTVLTANPVVGGTLTYQITVTNRGADPALSVGVNMALPAGVGFVSADSTRSSATLTKGAIVANLGTLTPGEVETITVNVAPLVAGPLTGTATVAALTPDPDTSNNTAPLRATIGAGSLGIDLAVSIAGPSDPIAVGGTLIYTITVANNGPRVATGVNLVDALPPGVTFLPDQSTTELTLAGNQVSASIGALAPGDSLQLFVAVQPTVAGPITDRASVGLARDDLAPVNNMASVETTVRKSPSVAVVTATPSPSAPGQGVVFTAAVTSPTVGVPGGSVTFLEGTTPLQTVTLDANGLARFTATSLGLGSHTITADYRRDASSSGSSDSLTQAVTQFNQAPTTTRVVATPPTSAPGQAVTFRATVARAAGGTGVPTGSVTFLDGTTPLGTDPLAAGVATFTTTALGLGSHAITARYLGDPNFAVSSGTATESVQGANRAPTATRLTATPDSSAPGQADTFTAFINFNRTGAGHPSGTVTFTIDGSARPAVRVVPSPTTVGQGTATYTTSTLAAGRTPSSRPIAGMPAPPGASRPPSSRTSGGSARGRPPRRSPRLPRLRPSAGPSPSRPSSTASTS